MIWRVKVLGDDWLRSGEFHSSKLREEVMPSVTGRWCAWLDNEGSLGNKLK